jgi:hypothetical protein
MHSNTSASRGLGRRLSLGLVAMAGLAGSMVASAAPVSIGTPFINLESRSANSIGSSVGQFMRIGAVSVTPNGAAGTTGVGTHLMPDGSQISRNIFFSPSPVIPNFFQRLLNDAPALRGDWQLTFTNGADSATRTVNLSPAAQHAPFVNSITLSGSSTNPTFTWTPPPGATVNGYRINIYDKDRIAQGLGGQVTSRDLLPGQTTYTVDARDFTVPGFGFQTDKNYAIEISLIQTKDNTTNTSNSNLQAIARMYADFRTNTSGGPAVNLPVVLANGSYQFDITVVPGQIYYLDPEVAIGYDFVIGDGDPNFATLDLPEDIGDGLFDIFTFDAAGQWTLLAADWNGADLFDFGVGGVSRFRVMGIETSAALDPSNTTAFVTGVSFTGAGRFTGTQTPIVVSLPDAVPEPGSLVLVACGLGGLAFARRRRTG